MSEAQNIWARTVLRTPKRESIDRCGEKFAGRHGVDRVDDWLPHTDKGGSAVQNVSQRPRDPDFEARIRKILEEDQELLERLAAR